MSRRLPPEFRISRRIQTTLNRQLMLSRATLPTGSTDGTHLWELAPPHHEPMFKLLAEVESALDSITHLPVWVVQYSGGKDSTAVLCLTVEYLLRHHDLRTRVKLLVTHNDTLMDAPPLEENARMVMAETKRRLEADGFGCEIRVTLPPLEDDFWVMCLGYGYPPFNQRFRPCTSRMKINPSKREMEAVCREAGGKENPGEIMALLLGVRTGESTARASRYGVSCNLQDGECGQILELDDALSGATGLAPIINAKTCTIWDAVQFLLPSIGYPTAPLAEIYGDEVVRFGCWMCPLVSRVRDVENLIQVAEWAWMDRLLTFRQDYLQEAKRNENRIFDERGKKRGLKLQFRQRWLDRLLALQEEVGRQLVQPEAVMRIRELLALEQATGQRGKSRQAVT